MRLTIRTTGTSQHRWSNLYAGGATLNALSMSGQISFNGCSAISVGSAPVSIR